MLIDLSGAKHHEYDISNVIACDVLDAECNAEKKSEVSISPMMTNVKKHSKENLNVTDAQIASIDKVIESYDCHFKHVLTNNYIQVLYPHDIEEIMHSCSNAASYNGSVSKILRQTLRQIQQILQ
jgi:phage FluMu protein gp41